MLCSPGRTVRRRCVRPTPSLMLGILAMLAPCRAAVAQQTPAAPAAKSDAASKPPAAAQGSQQAGGQISESQLAGLPLNGRSYGTLATLQAGISDASAASGARGVGGGSLTVAGGRSTSNNFLLDGTNIMDAENNVPRSAAGVQLGSDAVQQVQIFSSNYAAEYGRGSGGVLNTISRSGTNSLHGTAFEYFRNSKIDSRNFFDAAEAPPFKRNQFGGLVSGPLRKDASYFLFSFEAMRDRLSTTDVSFLPDAEAHQGHLPLSAASCAAIPGAGILPSGLCQIPLDQRVKPYLDLYPLPNDIPIGNGVSRNLHSQFLPTDETFFTVRVDQKIGGRDSFFAHYTFDDASSVSPQDTYLFQGNANSRQQYVTLVGTHVFSPRMLAAYSAAYTRPVTNFGSIDRLGVPRALYFIPGAPAFGQIQVPGVSNFGPETTIRRGHIMNTFQYSLDLVMQRGPHALKTGIDLHRYRSNVDSDFDKGGLWAFNSLENFLQAGPVGTSVGATLPGGDNLHALRQYFLGAYLEDQYRVAPRLSFYLGLRYEFASNMIDKLNRIAFMPDPVRDPVVQLGQYFKDNPSKRNFAPRLGFSWSPRPGDRTVINGGFGIHYDEILEYVGNNRKNSLPFQTVLVNPNAELAQQYFPDPILAAGNVAGQVQIIDYLRARTPMVLRYSLSVEQKLPKGWRLQTAYVGARGNRLLRRYESNQFPQPQVLADGSLFFPPNTPPINPVFGSISNISTDGQSFYNSLQITASKSVSRFSIQSSYSYSKSVDDNSTGNSTNFGQYALIRTSDRGPSDFDIRQRLSINYFYSLPAVFGGSHFWATRAASAVISGWRIGGIVSARTGTQFSPSVNIRYKNYLFSPSRPNLKPGQSNNPIQGTTSGCGRFAAGQKLGTPELYFDPCVFSAPPAGTLGNAGRNTIVAPRIFNMDLSLQKEFLLDKKRRLQFRAELFNFLNHTNFNAPTGGSASVLSGESGTYTSRAGRITQTNTTSRQIQFALRLSF
jgi:TonB-dependent receptor-like protein